MLRYAIGRLVAIVPVLFGASIIVFTFLHFLPGDPARAILGDKATPELVAQLRESLGLERPLWTQYVHYVSQLLHGDLGVSFMTNHPVAHEFFIRFPATAELAVGALMIGVGLGIPLGRLAAHHSGHWSDGLLTITSLLGISIPIFVLGPTLQFVFGTQLHLLPTSGQIDPRLGLEPRTYFLLLDAILAGRQDAFLNGIEHLLLPALTLGLIPLATIVRMTRAAILDVSQEDYVRTARAKGLAPKRISQRHIMRNAWHPIATVIGLQVGSLLAGAVVTETVFAWNGVGSLVVNSIHSRDYITIQSAILIFTIVFLLVNLIVDMSYAFTDPRIRYL